MVYAHDNYLIYLYFEDEDGEFYYDEYPLLSCDRLDTESNTIALWEMNRKGAKGYGIYDRKKDKFIYHYPR